MKFIFVLIFTTITFSSSAQTYEISYWQDEYHSLDDFTSIIYEKIKNDDNYSSWQKEFDFGFDFPYFDTTFTSIFIDHYATGLFENSKNFNTYLWESPLSPYDNNDSLRMEYESDARYNYTVINNKKVLIVEWVKNGLQTETWSKLISEHHLSFQNWFYEDGTIEVHFGEIHLGDTELFVEGVGIYWPGSSGPVGPWVGLTDFHSEKFIYLGGPYDNPQVTYNEQDANVLTSIPPEGWVIRFEYQKETPTTNILKQKIEIFPTLVTNIVNIKSESKDVFSTITDINGRMILESSSRNINVASLISGIYFIQVKTGDGVESFKFSKY